ncbi:hypothetical protein BDZ91DRAFT_792502 [Kalaharituber pfeilii]|nr:hypothetical protein BDZ91DRAFT_792502 [Kalaharituber pfeilii]
MEDSNDDQYSSTVVVTTTMGKAHTFSPPIASSHITSPRLALPHITSARFTPTYIQIDDSVLITQKGPENGESYWAKPECCETLTTSLCISSKLLDFGSKWHHLFKNVIIMLKITLGDVIVLHSRLKVAEAPESSRRKSDMMEKSQSLSGQAHSAWGSRTASGHKLWTLELWSKDNRGTHKGRGTNTAIRRRTDQEPRPGSQVPTGHTDTSQPTPTSKATPLPADTTKAEWEEAIASAEDEG